MNNIIPKIVHVCWNCKDIVEVSQSPIILNGLKNIAELNWDWKLNIYDDKDITKYLKNNISASDLKLLDDIHIVEKSDIWRLIKLYNEGGMYIDIDRFYNIKMSEILDPDTKCIIPTCNDYDFSHDLMVTAPGNPIFKEALQLTLSRRRERGPNSNNVYYLGPQTYMHAITTVVFGELINTNPGKKNFEEIREAINKISYLKTYRETQPYTTLVYNHCEKDFKYGNSTSTSFEDMKREFYAENNIKHWTGEW